MLYIRKRRTPKLISDCRKTIISTSDNNYDAIRLPEDTQKLRDLFDQMPKKEIRKALCAEQHGICAYCMRKIIAQETEMERQNGIIDKCGKTAALL